MKDLNISSNQESVSSPDFQVVNGGGVEPRPALGRDHGNQVVYLVWSGLRGKPETHQLRSVDTSRKIADVHKSMCDNEFDMRDLPSRTWIEERECDHMFGYELWDAMKHAERVRGPQPGTPSTCEAEGLSQPNVSAPPKMKKESDGQDNH